MRKIIIALLCCTILLLLGYSGYRAYGLWRQGHWMSLAKAYANNKDTANELLCLQQVLHSNPRNIEANRMMAQATSGPAALPWWEKVVELDPNSFSDRLSLAQAATLCADYPTAANALDGVDPADKKTANYLDVAGELAIAANQPANAEADFAQASRVDPSNPASQFSLAFIELHGTNALDMAEARITLRRLSMDCTNVLVRNQSERELVYDALRSKDYNTALSFSKDLMEKPNAIFPDKLLRLLVLKISKSDEYRPTLVAVEHDAANNAANNSDSLFQLTAWLMEQNSPGQALSWLQSLPPNIQTNPPAAVLAGQCQLMLQDWGGFQQTASREDWGKLDYTRHAYLSRALRQLGRPEQSKAEWDLAVSDANGQDSRLTTLFRFTVQWNWHNEAQQLLSSIVNDFPQEKWAPPILAGMLAGSGNTRPLMQLMSTEVSRNPSDMEAKNLLALTALLLRAQELNPYDLSYQVYQSSPTNAYYRSTYAFSLYLQGKNADALKIMSQLTPEELSNSERAGFYGLILKASGQNLEASTYLNRSFKGQLLPEERALFQQAMQNL
jgi:predicted Zn-dependent protease